MNENSRVSKTILNTIAGIASQFCNIILSFVLRTVFIHTLGVQYTGVSSVFSDILTMLSFSELGIGTAIATALYRPLKEHDEDKIRKLMHFYKNAYRIISAAVLIIGVCLLPFLRYLITDVPDIKENIQVIFLLYIIKTSVSYLLIYKTTLLNADQKQYVVKRIELTCIFIRYVAEIIVLVIFKEFFIYLVLEIVATIIQNIIVTRRAVHEYPYAFLHCEKPLEKDEKRSLFKDIKGLAMYQISASIGNSIDNLMVSSLISTTLVGLLANYTLIRRQIEMVVKQFFSAVVPSVGNLAAENNPDKQFVIFHRIFYFSFSLVNFCSVSLFVIINPFITCWLGKEFLFHWSVPFIVSFDFFLYILLQAIASFRTANGLFVKGQYRPLITAIMNVILTYFFIQYMGVFGAIFATVICRLITQWYDPYILFKDVFKKRFSNFYLKYWIYIVTFLFCAFVTEGVAGLINFDQIFINVVVRCLLCITIPNAINILLFHKTEEFRYLLRLVLKKLRLDR